MKRTLILLLLWPPAGMLSASNYYVSPTGDDGQAGTLAAPFLTIQRCANVALPGDTCFVLQGIYDERVSPPRGGTPGKWITFQAQGTVTMRGFTLRTGYIRVEGFQISNTPDIAPHYYGIYLQGERYEILNNTIFDTTRDGIYCTKDAPSVRDSLIRGNAIRYADGTGITLFGESNIAEHNDVSHTLNTTGRDADGIRFFGNGHIIRYNTIHDITEAEAPDAHTDAFQTFDNTQPPTTNILIEGNYCYNLDHQMVIISAETQRQSSHITIRNNVFESPENPLGWQLIYVRQVPYVTVAHNTFVNARYRALYIGDGATHATVKNNIFYNVPRYYEIETNSEEGFQVGYNVHYPTAFPASEPQGIYADPQFVDIANHDFHLKATSPAVDSGEELGIPTDKDGKPRPQGTASDRGAFEFGATTSVSLVEFLANGEDGSVLLQWRTVSELNNLGFHVYRSLSAKGPFDRITLTLIPGLGSSPKGASYQYRDADLVNDIRYYYLLEDINTAGTTNLRGPMVATPSQTSPESSGGAADPRRRMPPL